MAYLMYTPPASGTIELRRGKNVVEGRRRIRLLALTLGSGQLEAAQSSAKVVSVGTSEDLWSKAAKEDR